MVTYTNYAEFNVHDIAYYQVEKAPGSRLSVGCFFGTRRYSCEISEISINLRVLNLDWIFLFSWKLDAWLVLTVPIKSMTHEVDTIILFKLNRTGIMNQLPWMHNRTATVAIIFVTLFRWMLMGASLSFLTQETSHHNFAGIIVKLEKANDIYLMRKFRLIWFW